MLEYLIQAIVGKGLFKQYTRRQIAGEIFARTDLTWGQNTETPETHGLLHAPSLGVTSRLSTGSEAANSLPTDLLGPKSASAIPSLKIRSSPTAILGRSPLSDPREPKMMPEYSVVHNHCLRVTEDLESDDTIMQSYEYSPLEIGLAIGFQTPTTYRRVRAPPRKVTTLESLPSLSSEVAAEIARRVKIREQAEIFAAIREAQGKGV